MIMLDPNILKVYMLHDLFIPLPQYFDMTIEYITIVFRSEH